MIDIEPARGSDLTMLAYVLGVNRRRWLWVFPEPDFLLRRRVIKSMREVAKNLREMVEGGK